MVKYIKKLTLHNENNRLYLKYMNGESIF